jgi:hypothetical protein
MKMRVIPLVSIGQRDCSFLASISLTLSLVAAEAGFSPVSVFEFE